MTRLETQPEISCEECRQPSLWTIERWRAYWIDDGDEDRLPFYCAECAEREFGADA